MQICWIWSMGSLAMDPSVIFIAILVAIWFSFFWSSSLVWSWQKRVAFFLEHLHCKWKSKILSRSNSCSLLWEVLYGYIIHLYLSACKNRCRDFSAGQIGFAEGSLLRVTWSFADIILSYYHVIVLFCYYINYNDIIILLSDYIMILLYH